MPQLTSTQRKAVVGDGIVLVAMTLIGFATHLTLNAFGRMILTGVTALLAWAAVAPFIGVYSVTTIEDGRAVWRTAWAWLLAAPLATFLRGAVLDRPILPVFVIVVTLVNGLALVTWRIGLSWVLRRGYTMGSRSTSSPR